jgi:hypothetical protein
MNLVSDESNLLLHLDTLNIYMLVFTTVVTEDSYRIWNYVEKWSFDISKLFFFPNKYSGVLLFLFLFFIFYLRVQWEFYLNLNSLVDVESGSDLQEFPDL